MYNTYQWIVYPDQPSITCKPDDNSTLTTFLPTHKSQLILYTSNRRKKKKTTLQLRPKLLKRIKHRHPLPHRILHLIVHGNQLRHDVENLVEEVAGDGDDSFEGVAEDDVALFGLAYNFVYKKESLQWGVCG